MKKILVTGANGMLGQDLCPMLEKQGYSVIKTDIDSLDITDESSIQKVLNTNKPDLIIHCAAFTQVDKSEETPELVMKINAQGTQNIAQAASKLDVPIVYLSTDYVFDGEGNAKLLPESKTNPINQYGLSKLKGEDAVKTYCQKYYIVRTSWLYGLHGKNFVETMISLAKRDVLKVVDDQTGCPTWTVDLAEAIIKIISDKKPYGIYHACGGGETSWHGFAGKIFDLMKLNVNLKPCRSEDFPCPAKRPKYSVMDNGNLCRHWESALRDYLELRSK